MDTPLQSPTVGELAKALSKAQSLMTAAAKSAVNPHFKSRYADLPSVWEAIRAELTAQGIAVVQRCRANGQALTVETVLLHASGEWISDGGLTVQALKADAQSIGSAITYARRYGLSSMAGIAADDDDGEAAQGRPTPPPAPPRPPSTRPATAPENHALAKAIREAPTTEALAQLRGTLAALPEAEKAPLRAVYQQRADELAGGKAA